MLAQIDNQMLETSISQEKISDVRQMLNGMKSFDRQVQVLIRLASLLSTKGDKKGALELLAEARTAADAAPQSFAQMASQLQLVQGYSSTDRDQSFAIMQKLIARTNELIAAAATLDGFDARYLKDDEWITPGTTMLGNLITNLNQTLVNLAQLDFDRALSLANQIERPELRLTASLWIVRGALGGRTIMQPIDRMMVIREG